MPQTYTITDLANEFGITARTLRFYEDKGLIEPLREGTARVYRPRERARLKLILRGKRLGFSLAEIREFLGLYDLGDGQVTQMQAMLKRSRKRIAALESQRQEIDEVIGELNTACSQIETFLTENDQTAKPKRSAADKNQRDRRARAVG